MKVYGWCAAELSRQYSTEELRALETAILTDPGSINPAHEFHAYTDQARRKLDAVTWALLYHAKREQAVREGQDPGE